MPEKPAPIKKLRDKSTKQEMLVAYQALAKQLEEKRAAEVAPERKIEERKADEAVKVASAVAPDAIDWFGNSGIRFRFYAPGAPQSGVSEAGV